MSKWVLMGILTEDDVKLLADVNLLQQLAECSKPVIIDAIKMYLNSPACDDAAKSTILEAYSGKLDLMDALYDEKLAEKVAYVNSITYESIHAGLSVEELVSIKDTITSIVNPKLDVPYINPISGDVIADIITNLVALHRSTKNPDYRRIANILKKNKELFKDKSNATARGTIFKSISRRSSDLRNIVRGIDFLIARKTAGDMPESWRVF